MALSKETSGIEIFLRVKEFLDADHDAELGLSELLASCT
jgi:hypothetical protein